jgi:hypothetical protein
MDMHILLAEDGTDVDLFTEAKRCGRRKSSIVGVPFFSQATHRNPIQSLETLPT